MVCEESTGKIDQTDAGKVPGWVRYLSQQRTELLWEFILFSFHFFCIQGQRQDTGYMSLTSGASYASLQEVRAQIMICEVVVLLLSILVCNPHIKINQGPQLASW